MAIRCGLSIADLMRWPLNLPALRQHIVLYAEKCAQACAAGAVHLFPQTFCAVPLQQTYRDLYCMGQRHLRQVLMVP